MAYPDVRQAQESDQAAVGDLWMQLLAEQERLDDRLAAAEDARERWDNDFPVWLQNETRRVYVAEADDEIVAFASARRWGPPPIYEESSEVYLDEIYVRSDDRRQGYGTQLLHAVQDWTDRLGARRIRLRVLTANEAARSFWAAREAEPLILALTIERPDPDGGPGKGDDEGSKKIGF